MTDESWSRWQWIVVLLLVLLRRRVCPLHSLCGHTNAGGFEGSAPDQRRPNDQIPVKPALPFWHHFPFAVSFASWAASASSSAAWIVTEDVSRVSRLSVVFMKCKADKSEHHQDGSSHYQPMRIFHAAPPSRASFLRLWPFSFQLNVQTLSLSLR